MKQWLRGRTIFQRVALATLVLAVTAVVASYFSRAASSGTDALTIAFIACYFAFRKELLWRVRNRLLVTFLLFGVVPVVLIGWSVVLSAELLLGQFAIQRVRQELDTRIAIVRSATQNLAFAASHGAKADLLDALSQQVPSLSAVVEAGGKSLRLPSGGPIADVPVWIAPGFGDLFELDSHYYIGANVRVGNAKAFAYLPLAERTLATFTPGVVSIAGILPSPTRIDVGFGLSGIRIAVGENGVLKNIGPAGLKGPRGWWDVPIAGMLFWSVQTSSGKAEVLLPLTSRPSLLIAGVATGEMESVVLSVLFTTTAFFLVVEAISLFSSIRLTRAITRSVDDLYQGTLQVAQGDFSHQIPVRGQHQLSVLASSFNSMIVKIHQLIGEVKKKEKLDAELEIARQVQLRLFPKSVPKLKTLEMAAICIPGRVVSGDYYDYLRLNDRWTAIALGDVSGKGVSAALLMASIQSSLHAQLKFIGESSHSVLSTAALMGVISQQLYENTPPEKYATFFCSVYDDETGRLTYTNAGHLKPILVRDGSAGRLEGDGMVVGLLPNVKYEQQDVLLRAGDLVAVFSDGIPEAEDAKEQEFGEDRLAEILVGRNGEPLKDIIAAVTGSVEKWIYDPEGRDDLTLLLLRKL